MGNHGDKLLDSSQNHEPVPVILQWGGGHDLLLDGEIVFAYAADGAYPIFGNVFKGCAGGDAAIGVAYFGVIHITAGFANVLLHKLFNVLMFSVFQYGVDFLNDRFGFDIVQTGVVAAHAGFLTEDATRAAGQVYLQGVGRGLSPAHETGIGVGSSPDADYGNACERR